MSQSMTFRLEKARLMTANQRSHWTARSRRTSELRALSRYHASSRLAKVDGKVRVLVEYRFGDNRHRDAENLAPTSKALVDGIRDAHILTDDDKRYVIGVDNRIGATWDNGPEWVEVTITLEAA